MSSCIFTAKKNIYLNEQESKAKMDISSLETGQLKIEKHTY